MKHGVYHEDLDHRHEQATVYRKLLQGFTA